MMRWLGVNVKLICCDDVSDEKKMEGIFCCYPLN